MNLRVHKVNVGDFMENYEHVCIYQMEEKEQDIEVVEYAPHLFKKLRHKFGITESMLFQSFIPLHNI